MTPADATGRVLFQSASVERLLGVPASQLVNASLFDLLDDGGGDLSVVAEGVETEAQATLLRRLGCSHAQGHLGRPSTLAHATSTHRASEEASPSRGAASRP